MERKFKAKPPRLDRIFQKYDAPLFFVTFTAHRRGNLLANPGIQAAFVDYAERGVERHIAVGRYVIMPDHVHLFVRFGVASDLTLGSWIRGLKRHLDGALTARGYQRTRISGQRLASFWQPGFFDHLLRNDESYSEKWNYVRENPLRAGLVPNADAWPYAGEIVIIDRA